MMNLSDEARIWIRHKKHKGSQLLIENLKKKNVLVHKVC